MTMVPPLAALPIAARALADLPLALLGSTFATVFLAELGDKTQLAIVSISGTSSRPGAVFAGSSSALVLASLVGAGAGGSLSSVIPTDALQLAAAVGFLILGSRLILRSRPVEEAGDATAP
jgi:putative Ca2+/H+ antiporter (TMEM165/GDT1 family)